MKTKLFQSRQHKEQLNVKVFRYFAVFSIIILLVLGLFQVKLLDFFYRQTIVSEINTAISSISTNIENENLLDLMIEYVRTNEYNLRLIGLSNSTEDVTVTYNNYNAVLSSLTRNDIMDLYTNAVSHNGTYTTERIEVIEGLQYNPNSFFGRVPSRATDRIDYIIVARVITAVNNKSYLVLGAAQLEPVGTIRATLQRQLLFASLFMFVLSMVFAWFISKRLSNPVIQMTESAKELGKGNYDVQFTSEGFKELDDLNETLNYASTELKKVEQLQKELISNVSHDLRTPLTMIGGYAELLKDFEEERTEENFQLIIDETKRLNSLVDDILETSKNNVAEQTLNLSEFSLTDLLKTTVDHYQKMVGKPFEFELKYNEDVLIQADKLKLSQVIYNLLNNAVNYAKDDYHIVLCQSLNSDQVEVSVSNTGEPITAEEKANIFERYYRSDKNHVRSKVGSGIGLSIVKRVVEAHHGQCYVQSDKQNTFGFIIPVKQ